MLTEEEHMLNAMYVGFEDRCPIPPDTLLCLIEKRESVRPQIVRSSLLNYASYSGEDEVSHIFHRFNMEQA
ncbi:MAG: hypothetical protein R6X27_16250 [Candidatus Desulfacyla sp.]